MMKGFGQQVTTKQPQLSPLRRDSSLSPFSESFSTLPKQSDPQCLTKVSAARQRQTRFTTRWLLVGLAGSVAFHAGLLACNLVAPNSRSASSSETVISDPPADLDWIVVESVPLHSAIPESAGIPQPRSTTADGIALGATIQSTVQSTVAAEPVVADSGRPVGDRPMSPSTSSANNQASSVDPVADVLPNASQDSSEQTTAIAPDTSVQAAAASPTGSPSTTRSGTTHPAERSTSATSRNPGTETGRFGSGFSAAAPSTDTHHAIAPTTLPPTVTPPTVRPPEPSESASPEPAGAIECVSCPRPDYLGTEGSVRVSFDVAPDGRVVNVQLQSSSGDASLDQETLDVIQQWEFTPSDQGSQNIQRLLTYEETGSDFQRQNERRRQAEQFRQQVAEQAAPSSSYPAQTSVDAPEAFGVDAPETDTTEQDFAEPIPDPVNVSEPDPPASAIAPAPPPVEPQAPIPAEPDPVAPATAVEPAPAPAPEISTNAADLMLPTEAIAPAPIEEPPSVIESAPDISTELAAPDSASDLNLE